MGFIKFIGGLILLVIIFSGAWKVILFLLIVLLNYAYVKISLLSPYLLTIFGIITFFAAIFGAIAIIAKISSIFEKKQTYTPKDNYTYKPDYFTETDCPKGGKHMPIYYEHFGAQKRKCSKCGKLDSEYYIPNYYK